MKQPKTVIVRLYETTRTRAKVKSAKNKMSMMKWIEMAVANTK